MALHMTPTTWCFTMSSCVPSSRTVATTWGPFCFVRLFSYSGRGTTTATPPCRISHAGVGVPVAGIVGTTSHTVIAVAGVVRGAVVGVVAAEVAIVAEAIVFADVAAATATAAAAAGLLSDRGNHKVVDETESSKEAPFNIRCWSSVIPAHPIAELSPSLGV